MAVESVVQSKADVEANLEKAQAIICLIGAAEDLGPTCIDVATWAASDFIEEVLNENFSPPGGRDTVINNLRKVEAISEVMMAAKNPMDHWTYNAAWAIRGLIREAREANSHHLAHRK